MSKLKSSAQVERLCAPNIAIEKVRAICSRLNLAIRLERAGDTIESWTCYLEEQGTMRSIGRGKGLGDQALASAIFEALEHLIYEQEDLSALPQVRLNSCDTDQALIDASPDFNLICGVEQPNLTRLEFQPLGGGNESRLLFPAFLTNPTFQSLDKEENDTISKFGLLRYSTNSGTASGLTQDEAILHALLETVERDAIAILLLKSIIHRSPSPVKAVNLLTLPDKLVDLCSAVALETNSTVAIWDITSDVGIPAVLASISNNGPQGERYFGSGCSLFPAYAIERAVLEAVQSCHTYEVFKSPRPLFGQTKYNESSLYQRCFLEAGHFGYRGGSIDAAYSELGDGIRSHAAQDICGQIEYIVGRLKAQGLNTYWRNLHKNELSVVQLVVPQFDRFHLVSQGIPVAPSRRGRNVLL